MIMCGVHLPLNTIMTFKAQFHIFSSSVCRYFHFTFLWTQHAGHWSAFFLAVNRFVATFFPHAYNRNSWAIKVSCIGMIVGAWVIGCLNNLAPCLGVGGLYELRPPWYSCGIRPDGSQFFATVQALGVYIPEAGLVGLYAVIVLKLTLLRFGGNRVGIEMQRSDMERTRRRYAVAKVLLASSLWYCMCYFPNTIIASTSLVRLFIQNPVMQLWMRTVFLLGYAVNPVSIAKGIYFERYLYQQCTHEVGLDVRCPGIYVYTVLAIFLQIFFFWMSEDYQKGARRLPHIMRCTMVSTANNLRNWTTCFSP